MRFISFILFSMIYLCSCKDPKAAKTSFKVWGNCEMCKETIETSLKTEGIKEANWNVDSKIIHVSFDSTKISVDAIQHLIANSGYDNDKYKGSDSAYFNLPECCQYTRKP